MTRIRCFTATIASTASRHKGAGLAVSALAAVLAAKFGHPQTHYYGLRLS